VVDTNKVFLGILIILAFIWRFARTRQLYITSLHMHKSGTEAIPFNPKDFRSFIDQALFGRRSIKPTSFFIRAIVFLLVVVCLLPFKDYDLFLFWLVVLLIALYFPWCIVHGFMLRKAELNAGSVEVNAER
jgi:hypothetical protein